MKFTKEFLLEAMEDTVHEEVIGKRRWSIDHRMVFAHEGKFYRVDYSVGATEQQDEGPFEDYSNDELIECTEVAPVQKTITVYKPV